MDQKKWEEGWDCTVELLGLFQRYAGESRDFTPPEIRNFVNLELVTNAPVSLEFVEAAFELKASVIGGSAKVVTHKELKTFTDILRTLKKESTGVLPYLRYRSQGPSPRRMLELSRNIAESVGRVALIFEGKGSMSLTHKTLDTLVREAKATFKLQLPENLAATLLATKTIFFSGDPDAIEPGGWVQLLKTAGEIGGPLISASSVTKEGSIQPNEIGEFIYQLALDVKPSIDGAIRVHGSAIPMKLVDDLIDTFPNGFGNGKVSVGAAKKTADVIFSRFFRTARSRLIDQGATDALLAFYDSWRRGQTHLETIFRNYALNTVAVSSQLFANTANQYANTLDATGRSDVNRLAQLALHYRPMFYGDEKEMSYIPNLQNSQGNLTKVHLFNLAASKLLQSYSTELTRSTLNAQNVADLIEDIRPIGADLSVIDPAVDQFAARRFREADMFSFASNGDTILDIDEIVYYVSNLASTGATSDRVRADVELTCNLGQGRDGMGWFYMDPTCFRSVFFSNVMKYWDHEPRLSQQYTALSAAGKREFQINLERPARLHGYSNEPVTGYDAKGFILTMLLQENFFARFDLDGNGELNTAEALGALTPTRRFTSGKSGIGLDQSDLLDAIQTFPMEKGRIPKNDIGGMLEVGGWALVRPFWDIHLDRPQSYKTACVFADFGVDRCGP